MFILDRAGWQYATVCLEDIAEKLDETMDHWTQYMNVVTGEFEALPDGMYIERLRAENMEAVPGSRQYYHVPSGIYPDDHVRDESKPSILPNCPDPGECGAGRKNGRRE